jgi:outer membrane protein assembly factor BamE (lipoprotein component of BamABCDE complex)
MRKKRKSLFGFLTMLGLALFLAACGTKLTSENLNKIKHGMTETEVKAILGKPSSVENSEILGLRHVAYTYQSGESKVNINFINDSVISNPAVLNKNP